MSINQLFTDVSLEQQEIITGGIYVEERNYSTFKKDTLKQVANTSANHDDTETYHTLDTDDADTYADVWKSIDI
ncbi:hypothetical protein [Nostoc sp. TCL26-01]|uniref:hypothetical protein n=1 Tax=Nostoc sp. TCL26-01 TaxID=2576904 RepID=UPI0015C023EB|nr:hypothetical protein [Nostoc sp. TCL26-01]QLE56015.1 hypothetical protein FD725_11045 [Nostoc sp. TCL26-01]